jgi:heterodisulfide reductase subunit A
MVPMITFKLNGKELQGEEGQYILQVAEKYGIEIPTLCHHKALEPAGMCRLCTVELFDGRKTRFVTACNYPIWESMEVKTDTEAVHQIRKHIIEFLLARCPNVPFIQKLAKKYDIDEPRFEKADDDCILCGLCTRICKRMGNSAIGLVGRGVDIKVDTPFHVQTDVCMACGACAFVCPTGHIKLEDITRHAVKQIPSEYNEGLNGRKPIYVPYAQAIPNTPAIDRDVCVHFKTGGCKICEDICPAEAIDYSQEDEVVEIDVGAIIIATGTEPYDPSALEAFYHYKSNPDVITSLEFERILSPSGPTMGHLVKPSDGKEPQKIAWLQCVGSRDTNRCDNGYCSSVCCMYAIKDAMIAKEHAKGDLDCTIFNMDIRTFGKDYEKYYHRAKEKVGVRFIKTRVHAIDEVGENKDLRIRYVDDSGVLQKKIFDMVILSVGLQIPESTVELAKQLDVALDKYNFAATKTFVPMETSRPGVFACGVFQAPNDIPGSVTGASAAACLAGRNLSGVRYTRTKSVEIPDEIDLTGEEQRIGVFVCNCGTNIAGVVDIKSVEDYAKTLPNVAYAGQNLFTCSQDSQEQMKEIIKEHRLNRIVVAACTPKTHEGIFMDTLEACGLNKYLFEMANIRNQDSWVHTDEPGKATVKAKNLVQMAVARSATLNPLHEKQITVIQRALVIGGGVAGMNAALGMADQGFEVVLIEKEEKLGGMATRLTSTIEGADVGKYLENLIQKVTSRPKIQVLTRSIIVGFSGFKGNFTTEVLVGPGMYERKIEHGIVIMATGANEYRPKEFLYGQDPRVMTQIELLERLEKKGADDLNKVVMIQCVGSRNEENPNCSRVCCQSAIKNALHIKKLRPDADICILYRDIRTYGLLEDYYSEARRLGIYFIWYDPDEPPVVESSDNGVVVTFQDHDLGYRIKICTDILALSAGMVAQDTEELASIIKLDRNQEGHFMEAHVKLRPVDMATEGIFVCGTAHSPQLLSESISQAYAAASRATTFLSQSQLTLSAVTARVDADRCAACLICVRSCPYEVPRINEDGVSEIDVALCHGCGVCAAECPAKAIELNWYEDDQILCQVEALLEGVL